MFPTPDLHVFLQILAGCSEKGGLQSVNSFNIRLMTKQTREMKA